MLSKVKRNNEKGFTLIELMIVIAIIGILAAIAIPQFSAYRKKSYDAAAKADLRNLATAMEAYYTDNPGSGYPSSVGAVENDTYGFYHSTNVTVSVVHGGSDSYYIRARHAGGEYTWALHGPGGHLETE